MSYIFKSKVMQISLALILVVGLVCGTALPALADDNVTPTTAAQSDQVSIIKGKVIEVASNKLSFVVQSKDGTPVTITVNADTQYYKMNGTPAEVADLKIKIQERLQSKKNEIRNKVDTRLIDRGLENKKGQPSTAVSSQDEEQNLEETPEVEESLLANVEAPQGWVNKIKSWFNHNPKFGHNAKFEDIEVGDGIVVRVIDTENLARQVMIVKLPNIRSARGTVTAIGENNFTITTAANPAETLILNVTENTHVVLKGSIALKVGQNVTVTYKVSGVNKIAQTVNVAATAPSPAASVTN